MMEADWTTLALPKVLWLNTAVLVVGGIAMQWTRTRRNGDRQNK